MSSSPAIADVFPEVDEIERDQLRKMVLEAWDSAVADGNFDDITEVPWWPPHEKVVGEENQIQHIRDVTACAIAITDTLSRRRSGLSIDRDAVVAGALLHDISKLYEIEDRELTEHHELLPHPHYGIHLLNEIGFSTEIQHIVLAHSGRSGVAPNTIEAKIVAVADEIAVDGIFWESLHRLKE